MDFSPAGFRNIFGAFNDTSEYPDSTLNLYWGVSSEYIAVGGSCSLPAASAFRAGNLMVAHLLAIDELIAAGRMPAIMTSASIDKIAVGVQPPPVTDQFQYWLNLTPYGQQLLFLLSMAAVGGSFIYADRGPRGLL